MKTFIKKKCQTASYNLHLLIQIRQYLTIDAAKTLSLGLVMSHLDCTNSILAGLPDVEINKLQRIQNLNAKVIFRKNKYYRLVPLHV